MHILMDVQGPKLRLGVKMGKASLTQGQSFRLTLQNIEGDETGATLPRPEIFEAVEVGQRLLLDDGKVRLRIQKIGEDYIDTLDEARKIV